MKFNNQLDSQRGLSLIELMISITLGLILLTGVMQVFLSSKNVYTSQQALSRVQETGRLAIDFMARDIRMAGYTGCASRAPDMKFTNTLENKTQYSYNFEEAIRGYKAPIPVTTPPTLSPVARTDTDLVVVRGAMGSGVDIIENNTEDDVKIKVPAGSVEANVCPGGNGDRVNGLCKGDILFVSDCAKTLVFQATSVAEATGSITHVAKAESTVVPGNNIAAWGGAGGADEHKFGLDAEVLTAATTTFYIATSASDTAGTGIPSLWQKVNNVTTELLEGVENMYITYGEDTSGDLLPDVYREAANVVSWARVSAVRVELVVATLANNTVPETQKYYFKGATQTPDDLRLRQVFTTTIGIRSRSY